MSVRKAIVHTPALLILAFIILFVSYARVYAQNKEPISSKHIGLAQAAGISPSENKPVNEYMIKPSDVTIPAGVPIGKYRRITVPHQNWTLICDENLQEKKRICNVLQQIINTHGEIVFSWSLAGTADGRPVLILRTPAKTGKGATVSLFFPDKSTPVTVTTNACDMNVCIAMQQVGPRLKEYIGKGTKVRVSFPSGEGGKTVVIMTTFAGLQSALASI